MADDSSNRTLSTVNDLAGPTEGDYLLLVVGPGLVFTHTAPSGKEVVLGRAPECDIVLEHTKLSRRHASFTAAGATLNVKDLGSTNGTRVGGKVLKGGGPATINIGDSFQLGPFSVVVMRPKRPSESGQSLSENALNVPDPTREGVGRSVIGIAESTVNVLIYGETGVGKEVLAQTLHDLSGRSGPLVRVNCAALAEALVESELFGHEKGAFTGADKAKTGLIEAADKGTVFLDEIGELTAAAQAKLLRAIETKEVTRVGSVRPLAVDVRFLAATNRDLQLEVARGTFRRDLLYRLDGVTLLIPPLRERRGVIVPLALKFFDEACKRSGVTGRTKVGSDVLAEVQKYDWPGNVRELKAVVERAVLLAHGGPIGVKHMHTAARRTSASAPPPMGEPPAAAPAPALVAGSQGEAELAGLSEAERAERERIIAALEQCAGNQTRAAEALGISRATLVTKLRIFRIPRPRAGS